MKLNKAFIGSVLLLTQLFLFSVNTYGKDDVQMDDTTYEKLYYSDPYSKPLSPVEFIVISSALFATIVYLGIQLSNLEPLSKK